MGRLSTRGGVRAKGASRIQLDFNYAGIRYRPTIAAAPTESNLQRARTKLKRIKAVIARGTFSFEKEFPNYRYLHRLARSFSTQTCNEVFDAYLAHCAARLAKFDLAYATLASYRRVIDSIWRPAIGARRFDHVTYSMLVKIADARHVGKKTYNNIVSVLRRAFEHGYRDHPERHNPARGLKTLRIRRKDRPPVDPFSIEEAETLMAGDSSRLGRGAGQLRRVPILHGTPSFRADRTARVRLRSCEGNDRGHKGVRNGARQGPYEDKRRSNRPALPART
jgi:integrase